MAYQLHSTYKFQLADQFTPVNLYLTLRDRFQGCVMLESSDYHGQENSLSYLAFEPIGSLAVTKGLCIMQYPDGKVESRTISNPDLPATLAQFVEQFVPTELKLPFATGGFFGHWNYEAAELVEDINLTSQYGYGETKVEQLPQVHYQVFKYVIVFRHFHNELYLIQHRPEVGASNHDGLPVLTQLLAQSQVNARFKFSTTGPEVADQTNEAYLENIRRGIRHCYLGDVFQLVVSRTFSQAFEGDEFNVYRGLRSVNPSPYLFFFDYGNYKIFGSSPEAQLLVKGRKTEIHPIAGTFKRTADDLADQEEAKRLLADPKENAEHVMLVDLARNDLSRFCDNVVVERFREIQYYSHVIHLVSKVTGDLLPGHHPLEVAAATFPAGTLSGAPKHEAMKIIKSLEASGRGFYGGAIGLIDWECNLNHAIIIRSFLSINNKLYYRAGAGVVAKSVPELEMEEVLNKLGALKRAMALAQEL